MIEFPCRCGFRFSFPDDQAGGLVQCPRCHLAVDVPTLSDLANLNPDGTIAFEEPFESTDQTSAADLHRVFTNKTVDRHGREKDLRPGAEHFDAIGEARKGPVRVIPRYDPDTGELIRPIQLKEEEPTPVLALAEAVDDAEAADLQLDEAEVPMPVLPLPAKHASPQPGARPASLGYASGLTRKVVTLKSLPVELLMPANTVVMVFISILCLAGYFTTLALATFTEAFLKVVWPFLLLNLPNWMILAHLGCTIEDTGPEQIDELPRPMRNFSMREDFFYPLFRTLIAGAICFLPAILAIRLLNLYSPAGLAIDLVFLLVGTYFFPAVLLTSVAGTTVLNITPSRIAAVIRICGVQYYLTILLFAVAIVPSIYYLAGELLFPGQLNSRFCTVLGRPFVLLPAFMCMVYVLHYFGWHLGIMYRYNHSEFPWLAQRHIRKPREMRRRIPRENREVRRPPTARPISRR